MFEQLLGNLDAVALAQTLVSFATNAAGALAFMVAAFVAYCDMQGGSNTLAGRTRRDELVAA